MNLKLSAKILLSAVLLATGIQQACSADDGPARVSVEEGEGGQADDAGVRVRFAIEDQDDGEYWLTQTETIDDTDSAAASAPQSRLAIAAARRRRSTYRLPSMFGDFYGGSTLQADIQLPSMQISQLFIDNVNGIDFFVTNQNGGAGADPNPAVNIQVHEGGPTGRVITVSNGPGVPAGANNQSIAYPINDPAAAGFNPPQVPGPGTIVYNGGTAFYAGGDPPGAVDNGEGWGIQYSHQFTPDPVLVNLPAGGGAVRRVKIAENNSPIPRDRFIFNYSFFNDVFSGIGDVNRYSFGFEHTLLTESSSIEVLFPMASTLDVDQIAGGMRSTDTEFGDLTLVYKHLVWEREDFLISAGVGLTVPTGDDAAVYTTTGQQIIDLQHNSTHLLPFLAMLHTYDSGWYWQAFMQFDFDVNGNPLSADMNGTNLQPSGVLQDQSLLFVDLGLGYWLSNPNEGTPAVAATAELHWASTLQDADTVNAAGLNITSLVNRYDVVNLTLGASVLVNESFTVRPAMVIPLNDDQFDYEAMVQMNFWR